MAVWYVDVEDGIDGNAGTSFALRKKTFASASTAAAAGDTIRVKKSPDPTSLGQTATWTYNSKTVTLASAVTANVDTCESGWTASANVTATYTAAAAKEGTNGLNLAIAAGFTTGLVAYKTISSTDFSAYGQLSWWMRQSAGTLASSGDFSIKLCSDTAGGTPVDTFNLMVPLGPLNNFHAFAIERGAAMGTAIQSIAIYLNVDRGAQTFQFDNFIACKAGSAADSLTLRSLIGKNTGDEPWVPIRSINGATITLDGSTELLAASTVIAYAGTTETVTTWKRETVRPTVAATQAEFTPASLNGAGTSGARKYLSGGWDTTDMSTQTGDTYLDGTCSAGTGVSSAQNFWTVTNVSLYRFNTGFLSSASYGNFTIRDICGNKARGVDAIGGGGGVENVFTVSNISHNGAGTGSGIDALATVWGADSVYNVVNVNSNFDGGIQFGAILDVFNAANGYVYRANLAVTNCNLNGGVAASIMGVMHSTFTFGSISGPSYGLVLGSRTGVATDNSGPYGNTIAVTGTAFSGTQNAIRLGVGQKNTLILTGASVSEGGANPVIVLSHGSQDKIVGGTITGPINYDACDVTFVGSAIDTAPVAADAQALSARLVCQDYNATPGDHRVFTPQGTVSTATDQRHTASGYSWKFVTAAAATNTAYPIELPLASVACAASALVTCTVWVRRDHANSFGKLLCRGGQIAGVTSDQVAAAAGSADAWEQLTITFTPSAAGVVDVVFQAGTTDAVARSVWVDDFEASQA